MRPAAVINSRFAARGSARIVAFGTGGVSEAAPSTDPDISSSRVRTEAARDPDDGVPPLVAVAALKALERRRALACVPFVAVYFVTLMLGALVTSGRNVF